MVMDHEEQKADGGEELAKEEKPAKLEQNFNFLSICGIAVTTGESWIVLGNSLVS